MNFLAHFHLAWPDAELIAGGLEGDYYKGPLRGGLPPGLEAGVRLHRAIDAYTDQHPRIAHLRAQLPPQLRRYAGILIDLSFDHYLSRHWSRYCDVELTRFNADVYAALAANRDQLSPGSQGMLERLEEHDILNLYHDWRTVTATAERIGERFGRGNPFVGIASAIGPARKDLEATFLAFYPQLRNFSQQQIRLLR